MAEGRTRISEAASAKSGSWTGTGRSGPNLRRLGIESQEAYRGRPIRRGEKLDRAVSGKESRQDGRVVVYDRVRDQSRALVADLYLDIGLAGEFLLAADWAMAARN
jgi:hypothetical protein